ncbi:MAG: c-type cytochrome [Saprospiraceae bacterium]
MKNVAILFAATLLAFFACKHDPFNDLDGPNPDPPMGGNPCSPDSVYFDNQILPILISNCTQSGCHNNADRADGVVTTSFQQLMSTVKNAASTDPGKNKLLKVINDTRPDKRMPPPPSPALSPTQIALITQWVQQGARNNRCVDTSPCDTLSVITYSGFVKPLFAKHCTGCHGSQGGVSLQNYDAVRTQVLNGQLYPSVARAVNPMPKGGQRLSDCEIRKLKSWIDAGAPNN